MNIIPLLQHQNTVSSRVHLFARVILILLLFIFICGCSPKEQQVISEAELSTAQIATEQESFPSSRSPVYRPPPIKDQDPSPAVTAKNFKPVFKDLSPLEKERINISFVEEGHRQIFQILAKAAGLNLVLDPRLDSLIGEYRLTAEYQEIAINSILDAICNILDVTWHEQHSTLFIRPYLSKIVHLDFINNINQSSFSVGGDVLGGSSSSSSSNENIETPLTGRFEIEGSISETVTDIYTNIEETVGQRLEDNGEFMLNRQTGTLMMRGRPQLIGELTDYLEELREKYSKQVLIEAQIIEVNLDESQQLGIDWRQFSLLASSDPITEAAESVVNIVGEMTGSDNFYNLTIDSEYYNLGAVFRALKQYGNLKIISNPRLKAMNGQSALISVGQSVSYLRSLTRTTEGTGDDRSVDLTTEVGAIFDGILLGVTPIIKSDGTVTLHIVPIKSEIVELDQQDIGGEDVVQVTFPKINLREISTMVNVDPKNLVVLGGLIMEREQEREYGLPILGDIPFVGRLFKEVQTEKQKVELVIILKLEVLD